MDWKQVGAEPHTAESCTAEPCIAESHSAEAHTAEPSSQTDRLYLMHVLFSVVLDRLT